MEDPSAPDFDSVDVNPYIEDTSKLVSWLADAYLKRTAAHGIPRRLRRERERWQDAAVEIGADGRHAEGFTCRPCLAVHPEREIAEVKRSFLAWDCPACDDSTSYAVLAYQMGMGTAVARAIADAHAHNAERHPRRWLRSQHFTASIPADIRDRSNA